MATRLGAAQLVADATPATHNRVVTFLRTGSLLIVVLGHWAMQGVYVDGDTTLHRSGLLQIAPWTHPFTWVLQVMPLFFVLGGYGNLASWRRARTTGRGYGAWLHARAGRLTGPLVPLLVFWLLLAPVADRIGLGPDWLRVAGRASLVPTWFLAVYVIVVAATPLTAWLWARWGLGSVVAGVLVAALVDLVSLTTGSYWLGVLNVLVVWGTLHQVGYAWHDGAIIARSQALMVSALGFALLLALVALGPYAASMVGVSGFGVDNTDPTRVTLLLLGLWQAGIAVACEPWLSRVLQHPRLWVVTVALSARAMTIYLWHMTVLGIALALSVWAGGLGLHVAPGSPGWWLTRPLWFVGLAGLTALVVTTIGRFEHHGGSTVPGGMGTVRVLLAVVATCLAVAELARTGLVPKGSSATTVTVWLLLWVPVLAHLSLTHSPSAPRHTPSR